MIAILKNIVIPQYEKDRPSRLAHPIKMQFATSLESDELYSYGTTIEKQFCTKGEYDVLQGASDELLEEKLAYSKSLIGKRFEINLFKFTVKELTDNKYVAFDIEDNIVTDYHIASYMTIDDVVLDLKYKITIQGVRGSVYGMLDGGTTEEITNQLFFSKSIQKNFEIPYNTYKYLNCSYIVNRASLDDISKGHYLANQIKKRNIDEFAFDKCIRQIKEYRSKVRDAEIANDSIVKKIFFWKPKEVVEEMKLSQDLLSLIIDSIILSRVYPADCEIARKEYVKECENSLRKTIMHENVEEKDVIDNYLEFRKAMVKKYQGKDVVNVVSAN